MNLLNQHVLEPLASCREGFKDLGIMTVVGLYDQETILFAIKSTQTRTGNRHRHHTRLDTESTSCLTNAN